MFKIEFTNFLQNDCINIKTQKLNASLNIYIILI